MTDERDARVTNYIDGLPGWQRDMLAHLRELIHEAEPQIGETWKWDTPVFVLGTNVCAIGAFRDHVKVNFFKGASLVDARHLFNAGLDAKASRAIDLAEGDHLDAVAFQALVRGAVAAVK